MKSIGIIPARYASERLEGKPLVEIAGIPLFVRVWQNISKSNRLDKTIVAIDDERVAEVAEAYSIPYIMTDLELPSGTDRIYQALSYIDDKYDIIVNIQGDEPLLLAEDVDYLIDTFDTEKFDVATFISKIKNIDELSDPNCVKVVKSDDWQAVYFSRSPVPYCRGEDLSQWLGKYQYFKHIGIYAYSHNALQTFVSSPISQLEKVEKLEQLRLLEKGFKFQCIETERFLIGIDTPDDLLKAEKYFNAESNKAEL